MYRCIPYMYFIYWVYFGTCLERTFLPSRKGGLMSCTTTCVRSSYKSTAKKKR